MKSLKIIKPIEQDSLLIRKQDCACRPLQSENTQCCQKETVTPESPYWSVGSVVISGRTILRAATTLVWKDRLNAFRARISSFRMRYTIETGLYAVGNPNEASDVLVTANYKLSFDALRKELYAIDAWILVLDSKGINVWCAAGKGTFGTEELINRMERERIATLVNHRRIIVPQLGAPGIDAIAVQKQTGFRILYGPVKASDLRQYIAGKYTATDAMRTIRFGMIDRLILTPMEINPMLKKIPWFALIVLVLFGLQGEGIIFRDAFFNGLPFLVAGVGSIIAGAFLTPLFLPFIPFRSFAIKGAIMGIAMSALLVFSGVMPMENRFLITSFIALFTTLSSYIALQFTGSTAYTHFSGVKKEIRISLIFYFAGIAVTVAGIVIYKIQEWSLI